MEKLRTSDSKDSSVKKNNRQKNSNTKYIITRNKKSNFKIFLIIIFSFLALISIFIIILLILSKNKKKEIENQDKNEITKIDQKNYLEALYKVEEGKEMSIINQNEINLNSEDYYIELIDKITENNNNNLRNLIIIETKSGIYKPEFSGILSSRIIFKKNLNSLNNLFKNNKEVIKVSFNNLNMSDVKSMESTFSGCSNLEEINFEGISTNKLTKMENTFENCTNIKQINLSPLNTTNLKEMDTIFSGCNKLETIDLSSFKNIKNKIFYGITTIKNIIANYLISNEINEFFKKNYNIQINIIIIDDSSTTCQIGEKEKCKSCSNKIKSNCLSCNEGYYLPLNEIDNKICLSCNTIEHCLSCFGEKDFVLCSKCEDGFILINNQCLKRQEDIPNCVIGLNEKCKTCNNNPKFRNQCENCNEGYYLLEDGNKTICEKCDIDGCLNCSGTKNNKKCNLCINNYILNNNNDCIEENCVIGENEKCASCRTELGRKKECLTCNDGYYIIKNGSYICSKCSINNCKKCSIYLNKEICLECEKNFFENKNNDNMIESCYCPSYYNLTNGYCLKTGNWIEINYNIRYESTRCSLLNIIHTNLELEEIDVYINNSKIILSKDYYYNNGKEIYFQCWEKGAKILKINIKKTLTTMSWLFRNLGFLESIKFLPGFDSSKVTIMDTMFSHTIKNLDLKYLDTSNVQDFDSFILMSPSSLDLSSFNTSKAKIMRNMFINLKCYELDLSSFDTSNVNNCLVMFNNIERNCIIKISNKFTKCREQIPYDVKVINVDEINCKNYDNCEKCNGSKETLFCIKCKEGYQLINNKCIIPNCSIGDKEKCFSCKMISGYDKECLECNEGYYLPNNFQDKTRCSKCPIEGCKICDSATNNCIECKNNYRASIDSNSGLIISCNLICEFGSEDKCLTCDMTKGKESLCSSCNEGYKLINGKCKKIENSFIGIYNIISTTDFTKIMSFKEHTIIASDFDMYIDGVKVQVITKRGGGVNNYYFYDFLYKFPSLGKHQVKIVFNKTITTMYNLFESCINLISIDFFETFDTSHVLDMNHMFSECKNLEHVNVSSFNTSLVGNMWNMFYKCESLTSLNLSNFNTRNSYSLQSMFYSSYKLSYIDISTFETPYLYFSSNIFDNISLNGTIIIGNKASDIKGYIPKGWTIIIKE